MSNNTIYLGLGSNLANPVEQLKKALKSISVLPKTHLDQCSSFYGSKPLGPQDQPDFVNAVCKIQSELSPQELLLSLQKIEQEQGRIKKRHWGERVIDLDILLYGEQLIETETLIVPHSQIALRDFVLVPLAEISPGLVIPGKGLVTDLLDNLDESYLMTLN
ncbi:2-amino-4-hydroxy-6-hydroxymethyldihydropteridine diphosphokinase [Thiomicrorhabdus sp.]|uniref:2-amino-4-hydroxy-6- hydroxymethyldihydropteridine diphosphokinase n=1 Tax=Thiomicrorhabdus sp. TaxID=2039724 RepID=UPI002AA687C8|nr:2-amino-4-hydroxy-6-hydroxymethyldihydropteridine diphosphokinase [Thiomicrorhabdus sp.]